MKNFSRAVQLIDFNVKGDDRGSLISLERNISIPFDIQRVYYIFDTKTDVKRGFHAHRNLKHVLVCVNGSCQILIDNGKEKTTVLLDSPNQGLYLEGLIWREMFAFSENCVLMVLASELYDESDYIRNYEEFIKECQ